VGSDADTALRSRDDDDDDDDVCLFGMGVVFGSCGAMFIAAFEKKGAPSAAKPAITFGSSIDMSPKAEENPPSWFWVFGCDAEW
jgi:hypothetical protein